jgi:hypothetical protein
MAPKILLVAGLAAHVINPGEYEYIAEWLKREEALNCQKR